MEKSNARISRNRYRPCKHKASGFAVEANQITSSQTLALPTPVGFKEESIETFASTIKKLTHKTNHDCRNVVTALDDQDCFTQLTPLKQSPANWKINALLTSGANTPLPLDTLYFDCQKIQNKNKYEEVLSVFCRKQIVDNRIQLMHASNLRLTALEVESHAFERSFRYLYTLTHHPICWACVLIDQCKLIILLWSYEMLLGSFSINLEKSSTLDFIITKLYQHLMQLLGKYTIHALEALWIVGDHALSLQVEIEFQKMIGLIEQPKLLRHERGTSAAQVNWDAFYIALGSALYSLQ